MQEPGPVFSHREESAESSFPSVGAKGLPWPLAHPLLNSLIYATCLALKAQFEVPA